MNPSNGTNGTKKSGRVMFRELTRISISAKKERCMVLGCVMPKRPGKLTCVRGTDH